ncbi:hypothetical protein HAX54_044497 [Datura stramonium]|uniref:Uncharacterized protein n=1 Tax=Datura stramonium TaxID=4076 RepID=A0ABS8SPV6_DATST|nr:hypothetical protein [Datura stramonium]
MATSTEGDGEASTSRLAGLFERIKNEMTSMRELLKVLLITPPPSRPSTRRPSTSRPSEVVLLRQQSIPHCRESTASRQPLLQRNLLSRVSSWFSSP